MSQNSKRHFTTPAALVIGAAVLFLTLRGAPSSVAAADATPWWCLACGPAASADQFQNLLLLLPLGLVLALAGWSFRRSAILLTALPLAIELAQALLRHGRDAALGDLLANALGGMLGWWLGSGRARQVLTATWMAPLGLGLFVAQLLATASLIGPSLTGPEPWQLRLAPVTSARPTYRGEIIAISVGGTTILAESPQPAQPLLDTANDFQVTITWQQPHPTELTPIFRLDDALGWEIISADRRDTDIGISMRTGGGVRRWRNPVWQVPLPGTVGDGDTVVASLVLERGRAVATLVTAQARSQLSLSYGAQHGWTLINPFTPIHSSTAGWQWWTLAWLVGWGVVIASFGWYAARQWLWLALSLIALVAITAWSGARATPFEIVALCLGWGVVQLSRIALRRSPGAA